MAQDIFLKLSKIEGEAKDKTFKDQIDVVAWSWGASQSATMHQGGGGGGGKVSCGDIMVQKFVDKSTPILMQHCFSGKHIPEGELIIRKAGGTAVEYLRISMKEVIVASCNINGMGEMDRVTEDLTLNFAKVSVKYVEQKQDGGEGAKPSFGFDMAENLEHAAFKMG